MKIENTLSITWLISVSFYVFSSLSLSSSSISRSSNQTSCSPACYCCHPDQPDRKERKKRGRRKKSTTKCTSISLTRLFLLQLHAKFKFAKMQCTFIQFSLSILLYSRSASAVAEVASVSR